MATQRRIETAEAKQRRNARQRFATPGGRHDRLIAFLGKALPMGVGVLAAFMIITPLSPRGEISFLLDRNKVAVIDERLRVDNALYRGQDNDGQPFSLTAGEAVQRSSAEGIVRLQEVVARILLPGGPARLTAGGGAYDLDRDRVDVPGEVRFAAADGYNLLTRNVLIDLDGKTLRGSGGVSGTVPAGTFSANRMEVDLAARTVALDGNATMRMIPGKLRTP
ncbi:MAG: LPS export ABC transporter periplasmic protein LptC [Pontixanthobacter sp.]